MQMLNHILSLKIAHQKLQKTSFSGRIFATRYEFIFYYRKYKHSTVIICTTLISLKHYFNIINVHTSINVKQCIDV